MVGIGSLVIVVGGATGIGFLIRFLLQKGVPGLAAFAICAGVVGIVIPLLVFIGDGSRETHRAILIAASIIFGCGTIAASCGSKKQ
jgi:hypothetical protein